MENYIKTHRKLSAVVVVIAVIILIAVIFTATAPSKPDTTASTDPNTQVGDSDVSPVIQYSNSIYTIREDPIHPNNITVTAYTGYRNAAVNKLYELGSNPTDYKITFNYESPFKNYE